MPFMEWTDSLAVGIRSIDDQHRRFLALVNRLHDAAQGACPPQELVDTLQAYADEHFHIEEGYMQAFGYPDLEAHAAEHERFCAAVRDFGQACAAGQGDAQKILDFLKDWLARHLRDMDLRLGRFLEDYLV